MGDMTVLYGITNCSTVKKARAWLEQRGVDYRFHDFRNNGLDPDLLQKLVKHLSWDTLLNKSGMTWRKLSEQDKTRLNEKKALSLMLAHPTVIKRPVLAISGRIVKYHLGFNEKDYQTIFAKNP